MHTLKNQKIILPGGAGLVGQNLVARLKAKGYTDIVVLDKHRANVEVLRRWVGDEAWEVLWRRLFDHKFYEYMPNLSAAWIWSRIRRIGRSRYSLFREKLVYLEGGLTTLLQVLHADIEKNGHCSTIRRMAREAVK
jgi:protoporphyrinogen oxidase